MKHVLCYLRLHRLGVILLNGFTVEYFRGPKVFQSTETSLETGCIRANCHYRVAKFNREKGE